MSEGSLDNCYLRGGVAIELRYAYSQGTWCMALDLAIPSTAGRNTWTVSSSAKATISLAARYFERNVAVI